MESTVPSVFFVALSHLKKIHRWWVDSMAFRYIASTLLERMTGKVFWHKDSFIPMGQKKSLGSSLLRLNQWISDYFTDRLVIYPRWWLDFLNPSTVLELMDLRKNGWSRFAGWGLKTPKTRQDGPHLFVLYMFVLPSAVIVPLGRVFLPGCLSVPVFWENFVVFLFVGRIRK